MMAEPNDDSSGVATPGVDTPGVSGDAPGTESPDAATAAADADNGAAAISEEEVSALLEKNTEDKAVPFDFSACRLSRTRLPMLEFVCRSFAARASATVSGMLTRDVVLQFESLQGTTSGEAQAALPAPAVIGIVNLKPLPGTAIVTIEPGLLLMLLDAFFGGSGREAGDAAAVTAPAAQRFFALLIKTLAPDMTAAWLPIAPIELELVNQESNARIAQMGEPGDLLIAARFSVALGASQGRLEWLLPERLLQPVLEALASEGGKTVERPKVSWAPVLAAGLQLAQVEARAILAEAEISLGELVRLAPGDIIPIAPPQQVTLFAGNVPLYRGKFGTSQGRNALKITSRGAT
jgi:flagellar motor switch protein FliM